MAPTQARTAQVQTPTGWQNTSLSQLAPGDRFRMLHSDGSPVSGKCGSTEFTAGPQVKQLAPVTSQLRERVREKFSQMFAPRPVACA